MFLGCNNICCVWFCAQLVGSQICICLEQRRWKKVVAAFLFLFCLCQGFCFSLSSYELQIKLFFSFVPPPPWLDWHWGVKNRQSGLTSTAPAAHLCWGLDVVKCLYVFLWLLYYHFPPSHLKSLPFALSFLSLSLSSFISKMILLCLHEECLIKSDSLARSGPKLTGGSC